MSRRAMLLLSSLLLCSAGLLLNLEGCGGSSTVTPPPPPPPPSQKIHHVVVIFQENRSPDNLFHDTNLIAKGADIASVGLNSKGQQITLVPMSLVTNYDLGHSHGAFLAMYDNGRMDGADKIPVSCQPGAVGCPPPNPQFVYVNPSEVAPYFQLAEQFTFGDRMFQTNQGPSFPAHQFIISGTSAPTVPPDPNSVLFAAENPGGGGGAGCAAPPGALVSLVGPSSVESQSMYPCFEHPALTDLLDAKGVSWRYYTPSAGSIWTGPNAIQHICGPNQPPPNGTACIGTDWTNDVVLNQTQVLTDITNGQLPAVSWVIPNGKSSDHPGGTDGSGPAWVASVVNAIGNSSYWSDTAIFITWDDWGGWFDHVPPSQVLVGGVNCTPPQWGCGYVYGFRVPLIVVSPFAKAGYISHINHDFGSILKFVETTFSLPSLGYADASADDLSDCFDFSQAPIPFHAVAARYDASYFLNDKSPPTDPDDD